MPLEQLSIENFRNLTKLKLKLSPGVNFFYGENGSGKTSLLEAMYFLGMGRSFRNHQLKPIVQFSEAGFYLYGEVRTRSGMLTPIGLQRTLSATNRTKINGEEVKAVAKLAEVLPLQLIEPHSYQLIEEGPKLRRQFIDWGMFHVEHAFYPLWSRYQRALKQRNHLLRQGAQDVLLAPWNDEIVKSGEQLHKMRQAYVKAFELVFQEILPKMLLDKEVVLNYTPGWLASTLSLQEALEKNQLKDKTLGYTSIGPHRADLSLRVNGNAVAHIYSRGQQKLLISALFLAQGKLLESLSGKSCLYLIDDLASELDVGSRERLIAVLRSINAQVCLTGIYPSDIMDFISDAKMFHVEHGRVNESAGELEALIAEYKN